VSRRRVLANVALGVVIVGGVVAFVALATLVIALAAQAPAGAR
jgi:hypothetical protein